MTNTMPRRFTHDCSHCTFLGQHGMFDLYVCPDEKSSEQGTIIARHSSEGRDYSSGMCFGFGQNPSLTVARRRAVEAGLLKYDPYYAARYLKPNVTDELKDEFRLAIAGSAVECALQSMKAFDTPAVTRALRVIIDDMTAQAAELSVPALPASTAKAAAQFLVDAYQVFNGIDPVMEGYVFRLLPTVISRDALAA